MLEVTRLTRDLIAVDSPTGYTDEAVNWLEKRCRDRGIRTERTRKGALLAGNHPEPELLVAGHIDTLGAIVSSISGDGVLRVSQLGGWPIASFIGSSLTLVTHDQKRIRGCLLVDNPSVHANRQVDSTNRSMENVHVRLDLKANSREDLEQAGVGIGDIVLFDPGFEFVETGYLRSRFLDNKAGSACMLQVMDDLADRLAELPVCFFFSNYEEVGHGASGGFPPSVKDMLVIDMGVVGDGLDGDEHHLSICAKDSSGPYDYTFRRELVELARREKLPHVVDVYPYYGSDGSAALRGGGQFRVALAGPGVAASHGVERTHEEALQATVALMKSLLKYRYDKK